jgi:hypothetical protein
MRDFMVSRYIWPRKTQDIDKWIQNCLPCIRRKTPRLMRDGLTQSIVASQPLVDFVGPLTKDKDGNEYILTAIVVFTQFVCLPCQVKISRELAGIYCQACFFFKLDF